MRTKNRLHYSAGLALCFWYTARSQVDLSRSHTPVDVSSFLFCALVLYKVCFVEFSGCRDS